MANEEDPWASPPVAEAGTLLDEAGVTWWLAGGQAIDWFVGRTTRPHFDLDLGIWRDEALRVQERLTGWDLRCPDPPGTLRPWMPGERLPPRVHNIWCREDSAGPWRFELQLNDREDGHWVYRRDGRVRVPVADLTLERDGVPCLRPEVQLLFKSKLLRDIDEHDFGVAAPLLSPDALAWLAEALEIVDAAHPWRARLDQA